VAVQLIKNRFGRTELVVQENIQDLWNAEPVQDSNNVWRLRKLFDFINGRVKALDALGIERASYAMSLLPVLMRTMPRDLIFEHARISGSTDTLIAYVITIIPGNVVQR